MHTAGFSGPEEKSRCRHVPAIGMQRKITEKLQKITKLPPLHNNKINMTIRHNVLVCSVFVCCVFFFICFTVLFDYNQ